MSDIRFYSNLKAQRLALTELLQAKNFSAVPADWHVVIADIKNSTGAVAAGTHNDVNLIAAGSLIAGLNVAHKHGIEIPFFFGGDGGNLLVPDEILHDVLSALRKHDLNTRNLFGLTMHVGAISLQKITDAGKYISLAKMQQRNAIPKAVLIGDGLLWAEQQIKLSSEAAPESSAEELNMEGLECRWDRVKPPESKTEIVCYLIEACNPLKQAEVYSEVLLQADETFGTHEVRNPLSAPMLQLLTSVQKMKKEMFVRFGKMKRGYIFGELFKTALGRLLIRFNLKLADFKGKTYLKEVISNADTLTLDGRINMIVSGTAEQRKNFLKYLTDFESHGILRFGHHLNRESVMTCYIQAREEKHVHFVDGGDGGYTVAAKELKTKVCR